MGGSTITLLGEDTEQLKAAIKAQIEAAARMGLWVDSALVLIKPDTEAVEMYEVEYAPLGTMVSLKEIEKGPAFHVGVAGRFGPKPGPGQWVATVHVHT